LAIWCSDSVSQKYIRRIFPNIFMLITLRSSARKSEQKQLNTWVSFESAEPPLLGQFSVSRNTASC
jgi:hypothetical protein